MEMFQRLEILMAMAKQILPFGVQQMVVGIV
jgi:hypothetical protein